MSTEKRQWSDLTPEERARAVAAIRGFGEAMAFQSDTNSRDTFPLVEAAADELENPTWQDDPEPALAPNGKPW